MIKVGRSSILITFVTCFVISIDASESETEELDIVAHSDSDNEWNEETSEEEENGEDVDDDVEML